MSSKEIQGTVAKADVFLEKGFGRMPTRREMGRDMVRGR
jgi:hypothetical protein